MGNSQNNAMCDDPMCDCKKVDISNLLDDNLLGQKVIMGVDPVNKLKSPPYNPPVTINYYCQ